MRFRYSTEQLEFLRTGYLLMQVPELAGEFNTKFSLSKTENQIRATLKNHSFTCGRKVGVPKGTFRSFTQEQAQYVRDNYLFLSLADLTDRLNKQFNTDKTKQQVRSFTRNHQIRSGRTGQFNKGGKPWNAGTKGLVKPNKGNFTKGGIPANRKPIGHERICTKDGFVLIKVAEPNPYTGAPTRYRHKHVVVWEQAHGKPPTGVIISFIDGDKTNCVLDNLELITRATLLMLNRRGYNLMPDELKPSIRALVKLEAKQFELTKQ